MEPGGESHLETAAQVVVDLLVACGILGLVGGVVACTLALPTVLGDLSALRLDRAVADLWPGLTLCGSGALSFAGVLLAGGWRSERRVSSMPIGRNDGLWWQATAMNGEPPLELLLWPLMAAPANAARDGVRGAHARRDTRRSENGRPRGEGAGSVRRRTAQGERTQVGPLSSVSKWLVGETPALKIWALTTWANTADRAHERAAVHAGGSSQLNGTARLTARPGSQRSVPRGPAARRRRAARR